MNDEDFMRMAIEESKKGDSPYGAVLVKDGVVIAKAFNTVDSEHDITAHAEINVIRKALKHIPELSLKGFTLYTSSESCPMCTGAILWAEISRVVFGASIQNLMELGLSQINTPSKSLLMNGFVDIELQGSVLADEAIDVLKHWISCSYKN